MSTSDALKQIIEGAFEELVQFTHYLTLLKQLLERQLLEEITA